MSKPAAKTEQSPPDFESTIKELEALVEQLESGELGLSESLSRFEQGIALSRQCHDLLETARLKVTQLSNPDDQASEQPVGDEFP